jgi:hypothetical protein
MTAPALWRLTCLAAKAFLPAIMPMAPLRFSAALKRHILEPPRKRRYQIIPALS